MSQITSQVQWRDASEHNAWPFDEMATLTNGAVTILEGTFLDGAMYPVGGRAGLRLSQIVVTHEDVTLAIGDSVTAQLATCTFDLLSPPSHLVFADVYGRPAGMLLSSADRLSVFQSFGVGTHTFTEAQTRFAAAVVTPVPAPGVRGVQTEDGTVRQGDVWLVGRDGVVLSAAQQDLPEQDGSPREVSVIRVDVVGDPLFKRRLCDPQELFNPLRFVRQITFIGPNQTVVATPDATGDISIWVGRYLAGDNVLRVHTDEESLVIEAAGSTI